MSKFHKALVDLLEALDGEELSAGSRRKVLEVRRALNRSVPARIFTPEEMLREKDDFGGRAESAAN